VTGAKLSLVVTNTRVRTGDSHKPWATAVGIRDGKLAVVGMAAEILKMVDPETKIIDARGHLFGLPPGVAVGSRVTVTVAPDGRVTLHSAEAQ
jgi:predicted amidohydrolase YtcJ